MVSIKLEKGQTINVSELAPNVKNFMVTLGWDETEVRQPKGILAKINSMFNEPMPDIDCDATAFICGQDGKMNQNGDMIFYGNVNHKTMCVRHMGDDTTGFGKGADEEILVDLTRFPDTYSKVVFAVNIYKAKERGQSFGMIKNVVFKLTDNDSKEEICHYKVNAGYSDKTAIIFGELFKSTDGQWKFTAIGEGTDHDNITDLAERFKRFK